MKSRPTQLTLTSSIHWLMGVNCKLRHNPTRSGFTLVELLVALIIGSIITTLVLFSAVQLMGTNQREASRSNTQREMQAAIDYINRDIREAVYVYDGDCLRTTGTKTPPGLTPGGINTCPGILNSLPGELNSANNLPVLAFWRVDPLPQQLLASCSNPAVASQIVSGNAPAGFDNVPCSSRKMYTLVVYSLNRSNPDTWRGRARITRYTLPQFTFGNGTTQTPGWANPLETGFANWPRNPNTNTIQTGQATNIQGNNQVLVDFVDDRANDSGPAGSTAVCPTVNNVNTEQFGGFFASPAQVNGGYVAAVDLSRRTFYACVRGGDAATLNQEVIVRIRGNAAGQPGLPKDSSSLPIALESRILTRGVLGKN
ncbi:prepilin-type N-terminal cleavage/methylation domain-containing protein [filamentous cyanobacterium LEGE 11480]|uniref:Prepilin-type N-terminal cleavage/methylation domain-containing protein n=1 Tax=Romeriopsis navalis LEGE 11480 TaxID=2777977 RepID=A0A928VNI1_9CYAN|nr:prepilin-type N-terminal cleavage/methylation domain-containing protein [Romeriopsis navalis]MBE9029234.1 prepilin-type N-terminal cleavage/methylation domain-containing protein [Romeriopsis navalis LEGE 11480]